MMEEQKDEKTKNVCRRISNIISIFRSLFNFTVDSFARASKYINNT